MVASRAAASICRSKAATKRLSLSCFKLGKITPSVAEIYLKKYFRVLRVQQMDGLRAKYKNRVPAHLKDAQTRGFIG
jgi:hypothetical protein